ncbi:MAG: transketolase-like TK C-terminal-containing protein [Janthinobacterium lividum]
MRAPGAAPKPVGCRRQEGHTTDLDTPDAQRCLARALDAAEPVFGGLAAPASVLWSRFLRFDAADPGWPDRDRFVVSAAEGGRLLQGLLRLTGGAGEDEVPGFGSHPAVESAPGPPGFGVATAVGMALAERMMAARFGRSLVDHRTWVVAGGAELATGISLEAACLAGELRLERLTVLCQAGGQAGSGEGDEQMRRFAALGWSVRQVDARDEAAVGAALFAAVRGRRPALIACRAAAGGEERDGDAEGEDGLAGGGEARLWREAGRRGAAPRRAWLRRLTRHPRRGEFERVLSGRLPEGWQAALSALRGRFRVAGVRAGADGRAAAAGFAAGGATNGVCDQVLDALAAGVPELLGGLSGDWPEGFGGEAVEGWGQGFAEAGPPAFGAGDREAWARDGGAAWGAGGEDGGCEAAAGGGIGGGAVRVSAGSYGGRHVHWGGRALGMAAALNGVALHGGLIPLAQAPFAAGDVMRPALQLAARMRARVIHVLTQDDEVSHLPAGNLASLRAVPGLHVLRPADPAEVAECCELALRRHDGPSLLVLSRRPGGALGGAGRAPLCRRGGYVLQEAGGPRDATLIASGPELAVAVAARAALRALGLDVAVASLPCWELFALQEEEYRADVLGRAPRFGIEAAQGFGWERWLGADGVFVGPEEAGGRALRPTAQAVVAAVRRRLGAG